MRLYIEYQNIKLAGVEGTHRTFLEADTITMIPQSVEVHTVSFQFLRDRVIKEFSISLPVKADNPPKFLSTLDNWNFQTGQSFKYRPIVVDFEGDFMDLVLSDTSGGNLKWDNKDLHFQAEKSGNYSAEFIAKDTYGNISHQKLIWHWAKMIVQEKSVFLINLSGGLLRNI